MNILLPMPVKPSLSLALFNKMNDNLYDLVMHTEDEIEIRFNDSEFEKQYEDENFFARLARMRQTCVDEFLQDQHTDVMWIDADIVEYPRRLPQILRSISRGVISPLVLIENSTTNYDTAGMRQSYEGRSMLDGPYFSGNGPLYDMESVGCCVLVPAEVHRQAKFEAQPDDEPNFVTEWWSICQAAKELGYPVQCTTEVIVRHADLPRYGEKFH